jgi:hypothetical protein
VLPTAPAFAKKGERHHAPFLPRRSLAVAGCLAYLPGMTADQTDYVVKHRASPPKPWRWEIYRAGRSSPVAQSSVYFETMTLARKAGKEALKQLLDKLHSQPLRWPRL